MFNLQCPRYRGKIHHVCDNPAFLEHMISENAFVSVIFCCCFQWVSLTLGRLFALIPHMKTRSFYTAMWYRERDSKYYGLSFRAEGAGRASQMLACRWQNIIWRTERFWPQLQVGGRELVKKKLWVARVWSILIRHRTTSSEFFVPVASAGGGSQFSTTGLNISTCYWANFTETEEPNLMCRISFRWWFPLNFGSFRAEVTTS